MLREIAGRRIGEDSPLFVVAEVGLNHGGSVDRALALVDAAAEAGASAIKLQTLSADRLVIPSAPPPPHVAGKHDYQSLADFFRTLELDDEASRAVIRRARERGLAVMATPLYLEAVDLLESIGIDAYKIASGDLTWAALVERAARTRKPLVLSTGMSGLDEVATALGHAVAAGAADVALLHCVSRYPVPAGAENLRAIQTLSRTFGIPVGLSDHGTDPFAAAAVVALGGTLYEKHLVLDGDREAVDAAVSATPGEFAAIVRTAERMRRSLGTGEKVCLPIEQPNLVPSRRSLRASRALPAGHVVGADDIVVLRPGDGLNPGHWQDLIGAVLRRSIGCHEPFLAEDIRSVQRQASHVD